MDTTKLTREEALRRWKASKETKRKMVEKLESHNYSVKAVLCA